jgi:hypothetical protein
MERTSDGDLKTLDSFHVSGISTNFFRESFIVRRQII